MGTRNLTCVVLGGEYRVAQYGQWDGYPSGQGETVLQFLLGADLPRFREQIQKTRSVSLAEANEKLRSDDASCPFSRDMGAKILSHLQAVANPEVYSQIDFAADSLFCEWAYVVDLDNNALEIYRGFNRTPLAESDRFFCLEPKSENGYHPIRLFKKLAFAELKPSTMADIESDNSAEAEA